MKILNMFSVSKKSTPLYSYLSVVELDDVQRLETRRNSSINLWFLNFKKLCIEVSNSHYGSHRIINWVTT